MPYSALKPCPKHPDILLKYRAKCPKCPVPVPRKPGWKSDKVRGNRHKRGYGTEWDKIRRKVLVRDNYICSICGAGRCRQVDHIIPKCQQGTNRLNNLRSICDQCHKIKTNREAVNNFRKSQKNQ